MIILYIQDSFNTSKKVCQLNACPSCWRTDILFTECMQLTNINNGYSETYSDYTERNPERHHHWYKELRTMLHNTCDRQGKNMQKSPPSALSDAEVPRPVSPLSDVPGRRPKRLWNFSDTAGVCHSMSANRANVYLWNRAITTKECINQCWTDTIYALWLHVVNFMHFCSSYFVLNVLHK